MNDNTHIAKWSALVARLREFDREPPPMRITAGEVIGGVFCVVLFAMLAWLCCGGLSGRGNARHEQRDAPTENQCPYFLRTFLLTQ